MHPWMAVWMWSMTMSQARQNSLSGRDFLAANENNRDESERLAPILINASDYLKSDIVEQVLPDMILGSPICIGWSGNRQWLFNAGPLRPEPDGSERGSLLGRRLVRVAELFIQLLD